MYTSKKKAHIEAFFPHRYPIHVTGYKMMVNRIHAIIKVFVNNGANHECGIISKSVKTKSVRFGIKAAKNVLCSSFRPL